jgi:addiction module RelB/DinJ family antitoxin
MPEARLSVRVDEDIKRQAGSIFRRSGLTLSAGINLYLSQVALHNSIPLLQTSAAQDRQNEFEIRKQLEELKAQIAVNSRIKDMQERGAPVALYDDELKRPYLEYPDGKLVYDGV